MRPPNTTQRPAGFSLVELMVVVTTIGILALLGVPGVRSAANRTEATATANDVRVFADAVEFYSTASGGYPNSMTYTNMPEEVAEYLAPAWKDGSYSWFYINSSRYTYIYIYNLSFSTEQALRVDSIIDDGNLATGNVRIAFNGSGLLYLFRVA